MPRAFLARFVSQVTHGYRLPPSIHATMTQCCVKVTPASKIVGSQLTRNICMTLVQSKTLGRRCTNVIQMCCACWANLNSEFGQRLMFAELRQWAKITPAMGQRIVLGYM